MPHVIIGLKPHSVLSHSISASPSYLYRAEEKCLVRSGLVQLLDKLCSLTNTPGTGSAGLGSSTSDGGSGGAGGAGGSSSDANVRRQKVSAMAWAGFQVLSNRCVMWEQEDGELGRGGLFSVVVCCVLSGHSFQELAWMTWNTRGWPDRCPSC